MESTASQLGLNDRTTGTPLRGTIRIVSKVDDLQLIVPIVVAAYPQVHRQVEPL